MKNKQQILEELEAAIDRMDMREIDSGLAHLSSVEAQKIEAEEVGLFSARIQKLSEEKQKMKQVRTPIKVIVAAALVLAMSVTAFAASRGWNIFTVQSESGNRFAIVQTTEQMSDEQLQEWVKGLDDLDVTYLDGTEQTGETISGHTGLDMLRFDSIEQAGAELNIPVVLPSAMPEMQINLIMGYKDPEVGSTGYFDFIDDAGRMLDISITRTNLPANPSPDEAFVVGTYVELDGAGSMGTYTSASGVAFTTITETEADREGRTTHIAIASLHNGRYQYAITFHGFDEAERNRIIDSIDFSAFR